VESLIPGTEGHHRLLVERARQNVAADQQQQTAEDTSRLHQAQAVNAEAMPELNQAKQELAASKLASTEQQKELDRMSREKQAEGHDTTRKDVAGMNNDTRKLIHGYRQDEEGNDVAIPVDQLSAHEQNIEAYKKAQIDYIQKLQAYKEAQTANIPEQMRLRAQQVETAKGNLGATLSRLKLSQEQFEANNFGTYHGAPIAGTLQTDQGTSVGSKFQNNVRPTGAERNKGDMANSAHEQLGTIKDIVQRRPDIFGPAAGRKTDFTVWLGSQDPDAQRFRAARTIAGDHLAGTFGGRSESALKAIDNAIGQFKDNPAAVAAGLDQLEKGNEVFRKAGTVHAVGSSTEIPKSSGKVEEWVRDANGKLVKK